MPSPKPTYPLFPQGLLEAVGVVVGEVLTFDNFRSLDDEQIGYLILSGLDAAGWDITHRSVADKAAAPCAECGHPDAQHDEAGCLWPQWADTPGVPTCPCPRGSDTGPLPAPKASSQSVAYEKGDVVLAADGNVYQRNVRYIDPTFVWRDFTGDWRRDDAVPRPLVRLVPDAQAGGSQPAGKAARETP